jgi:hypothetical protein
MRRLNYWGALAAVSSLIACAGPTDTDTDEDDGGGNQGGTGNHEGGDGGGGDGGSGNAGGDEGCDAPSDCDDGDACTEDDCVAQACTHNAVEVDDGDACTDDSCDATSGVAHTAVDVDDMDVCTTDDCDAVTGPTHEPLTPDDMEVCTIDSCDPATGPVFENGSVVFEEDFSDNTAGWTLDAEWQIGPATASSGQEYAGADPAEDHTPTADNGVAGVAIGGNTVGTAVHAFYYLTSPAVDASAGAGFLELRLWRWLNSDYDPYMHNRVEVYDGATWQVLWTTAGSPGVQDPAPVGEGWFPMSFDITSFANAALQVRFGFDIGNTGVYDVGGWNVDDVAIVRSPVVTDADPCTQLSCVSMTGAVYTPFDLDDGDSCTADSCGLIGIRHEPPVVDDGNACTVDSCDPVLGVIHTPVDTDDGDNCTVDACTAGGGVTHTPLDCNDGDGCTADSCDQVLLCVNTPFATTTFFAEDFSDNSAGWTLGPEWQIGPAVAGPVGNCEDPGTDFTPTADNGVAGVALGGCSPSSVANMLHAFYWLESPSFDTTGAAAVYLHFRRWLLSDFTPYMNNAIEVFDGAGWVTIWQSGGVATDDPMWQLIVHDLSAYSNSAMRVRFGFDIGNSGVFDEGSWNLDDVSVTDNASECVAP